MHPFARFKCGHLHLERVELFSDGVFAIVVTLLVLELKLSPIKDHASVSELAHHLVELAPKLLGWLISFIIVCKFWLNHNHVLSLAHRADYGLAWLNSLFLMGQAFIPFPTAMMGEDDGRVCHQSTGGLHLRPGAHREHAPVHRELYRAQPHQA